VLAVAVVTRYRRRLARWWRATYAVSAITAQYLNFFVLIAQLFLKVPVLKTLAPTQSEPVFTVTQLITLELFAGLAVVAALRFRQSTAVGSSHRESVDSLMSPTYAK
jgi:hypothetical protein